MYDPRLTPVQRLRIKIRENKRYLGITNVFQTDERFSISVDKYTEEVRTMFKLRKFRSLDVNSPKFTRQFAEAIIQDQSYRSRMTEMLTQCHSAKRALDRLVDVFYDYAIVEYAADLKIFGTQKEREAFLNTMMKKFKKYTDDLDTFIVETDYYIKDIDKAGYSAKNIAEVYAIVFKKEGNIPMGNM